MHLIPCESKTLFNINAFICTVLTFGLSLLQDEIACVKRGLLIKRASNKKRLFNLLNNVLKGVVEKGLDRKRTNIT